MDYQDLIKQPNYEGLKLPDMIAFKEEFDEAVQRVKLLVEGADGFVSDRNEIDQFIDHFDEFLDDYAIVTDSQIEEALRLDAIDNDNGLDDDRTHPSWRT